MKWTHWLAGIALCGYRWLVVPARQWLVGPGPACRFTPTCSTYVAEAFRTHAPWRAAALGVSRLCRCHPWGAFGWDPVPPAKSHPGPACSRRPQVDSY